MGKDLKVKIFITLILFTTFSLSILNFIVSLVSHSSVIFLTCLINLSQFIFYFTKHRLSTYKKKLHKNVEEKKNNNTSDSSRFGILVDLINSTFVCANCFLTIIKSIQSIANHHNFHDLNQDNDKLHHAHENLKPYDKEKLMLITGLATFIGDFLIFVIFIVLNSRESQDFDAELISETSLRRNDRKRSFVPSDFVKLKKENCILIIPSDLVKYKKKFLDIIILFIGSLFTLLCVFLNKLDLEIHHEPHYDELNLNLTTSNETIIHHKHVESNNHVETFYDLIIINIDPLLSIIIAFVYFYFFASILKVCFLILSQAVPGFIDIQRIKSDLLNDIPDIKNIHNLNLYEYNPFHLCISMHFVIKDNHLNSKRTQIKYVSDKIFEFFSSEYFVYKIILQPEVVQDYDQEEHENVCFLEIENKCSNQNQTNPIQNVDK